MFTDFVMQNLLWFGALIVVLNLLIMSYLQANIKGVGSISPLQLPQLQRDGKSVIIDINDDKLFSASHIPDAVNFSLQELSLDNKELLKHKNKTIILACQSGTRSPKAAKALQSLGFEDIHILKGGLLAWGKENLPLTSLK